MHRYFRKPIFLVPAMIMGLIFVPAPSAADTPTPPVETITHLNLTLQLTKDGTLDIIEQVDYTYASAPVRAITHSIPTNYLDDQSREHRLHFTLISATQDGQAFTPATNTTPAITQLTLPPPAASAAATRYELHYKLQPVIVRGPTHDILKLNLTGSGWLAPIESADLVFRTPGLDLGDFACFTGIAGATTSSCQTTQDSDSATAHVDTPLAARSSISLHATFPSNSFTQYLTPYVAPTNWTAPLITAGLIAVTFSLGLYWFIRRLRSRYPRQDPDQRRIL